VGQQLALNIQLRDDSTFESFYPGDNQEAFQAVKELLSGHSEPFLYLWGNEGVGKSHLLQAACHQARNLGLTAVYIPLREARFISRDIFQGLEEIALVCLDDVDSITSEKVWEEALFHLFNKIRANNSRLLVASNTSAHHIKLSLPDLKSRLSWGVTYQIHALQDNQKCDALALRAECRGLFLNKTVGQFLLNHCPRNMSELFHTLEILDKASLMEQRRLTIPFVKEILKV
jgi:DnaA-homolog protein